MTGGSDDIDRLRRKRQRNVGQQCELHLARIREIAMHVRTAPMRFQWLWQMLAEHGESSEGILVSLTQFPEQDGECTLGEWLTLDHRFLRFQVTLDRTTKRLLEVDMFEDVTSQTDVRPQVRGIGKAAGYLALSVLSEHFPPDRR